MNRRRSLLIGMCAAIAAPCAFAAQQASPKRIGLIGQNTADTLKPWLAGFHAEMQRLGHTQDRDYVIEFRSSGGNTERLTEVVAELVAMRPSAIIASNTSAALALKAATTDVPILLVFVSDPLVAGLVTNLVKPGGNITGLFAMADELQPKLLELIREIVPKLERVGSLFNPGAAAEQRQYERLAGAAEKLGVRVIRAPAPPGADLPSVFARLAREKAGAVIVQGGINQSRRTAIAAEAAKYRMPAIYRQVEFVHEGGLISYGPDFAGQFRRLASYVDKIFRGARPGELPIEQATKLELVVNLKAAKAIGIAIPHSILLRADKVIE